ncbi:MAG TPA: GNAT family N-acetyltransferase [Longimicrobiaceae bacterium]
MPAETRILGPGEADVLARVLPGVFDDAIDLARTEEFLADPRHHLAVAIEDGVVIGFASGVDYIHPDKPRELWINEVGVAPERQGRGVGKAVVRALLDAARALGCREAWVLTERGNAPALGLYASLGGQESEEQPVMFTFRLDALPTTE